MRTAFQEKKKLFYEIIDEIGLMDMDVKPCDYSEDYASRRELFCDLTHLNLTGAGDFTSLINRTVLVE